MGSSTKSFSSWRCFWQAAEKEHSLNYLTASVFSLILVEFPYSYSAQSFSKQLGIVAWVVPFLWQWLNIAVWKEAGNSKAALLSFLHRGWIDLSSKGLLHTLGKTAPLLKIALKRITGRWTPIHTVCVALASLKLHRLSACEAGTSGISLHGWT